MAKLIKILTLAKDKKFYIGVADAVKPFCLYGPNRPTAKGALTRKKFFEEYEKVVKSKMNSGYKVVSHSQVPSVAIDHAHEILAATYTNGDKSRITFTHANGPGFVVDGDSKPRVRTKAVDYAIWI